VSTLVVCGRWSWGPRQVAEYEGDERFLEEVRRAGGEVWAGLDVDVRPQVDHEQATDRDRDFEVDR
jgi:hypothetical protein